MPQEYVTCCCSIVRFLQTRHDLLCVQSVCFAEGLASPSGRTTCRSFGMLAFCLTSQKKVVVVGTSPSAKKILGQVVEVECRWPFLRFATGLTISASLQYPQINRATFFVFGSNTCAIGPKTQGATHLCFLLLKNCADRGPCALKVILPLSEIC